jgi:hypothetical protein
MGNLQLEIFEWASSYIDGRLPLMAQITASVSPTTNRIHAICIAMPATPDIPSTAAMRAKTKNVAAQEIMVTTSGKKTRRPPHDDPARGYSVYKMPKD